MYSNIFYSKKFIEPLGFKAFVVAVDREACALYKEDNRPYEGKTCGMVVDYIGIFENLQRAFAFDSKDISRGLLDIELLKKRFEDLMGQAKEILSQADIEDEKRRVTNIIDFFFDEERRVQHFLNSQELRNGQSRSDGKTNLQVATTSKSGSNRRICIDERIISPHIVPCARFPLLFSIPALPVETYACSPL
ncbi:MAG: hypothetical protein ACXQTR_00385 [Candidatus Methanospirareceae archaeon]